MSLPAQVLDPERELLRVRASSCLMIAGACEVMARIARDVDPALAKLLTSAHGQALHVMARSRAQLDQARHENEAVAS